MVAQLKQLHEHGQQIHTTHHRDTAPTRKTIQKAQQQKKEKENKKNKRKKKHTQRITNNQKNKKTHKNIYHSIHSNDYRCSSCKQRFRIADRQKGLSSSSEIL